MAEPRATPEAIISRATAAVHAGHLQKGARLAYQAAWDALTYKASRHGRTFSDDDEALGFTQWLDANNAAEPVLYDHNGECLGRALTITSDFLVAMSFKEHAETPLEFQQTDTHRYWEPHEYRQYLPLVTELIRNVNDIKPQDEG